MARAALYCRVSTEEQSEHGFGLDAQRRILTEYCQREGHSAEFFVDAGISGETISARPELQRLLREVKSGKFDLVLAVDADRYSRASDLSDWQTIKRTFRDAHIKWGTPSTWLNDAEFVTDVLSAVSAEEKRKILARTLRGKLEAVRRNNRYFAANAPYGYRLESGTLFVADDEAAIVRKMFKMALDGGTIYSISRSLTAEGLPTPMAARGSLRAGNSWQPSTVHGILHNRLYTGTAVWNRHRNVKIGERTSVVKGQAKVVPIIRVENRPENEHIQVKVPALIDVGTFEAAQESLKQSASKASRHLKRRYLLRGIVFCSCGRRMYGRPEHGTRYYRCSGRSTQECQGPIVRANVLETLTGTEVLNVLSHPKAVMALVAQQRDRFGKRDEGMVRLDAISDQIARIHESRSRLIDFGTDGAISKAEFKEKMAALNDRKSRLEQERSSLMAQMGHVQADEVDALRLATLLVKYGPDPRKMPKASSQEWAEIVRTVMTRVTVQPDGSLQFTGLVPTEVEPSNILSATS